MFDSVGKRFRKTFEKYGDKLLSIKTDDEAVEFLHSLPKGEEAAIIATMGFIGSIFQKNNDDEREKMVTLIANGAEPWQAAVLFVRGLGDKYIENADKELDALKKALDKEQSNS